MVRIGFDFDQKGEIRNVVPRCLSVARQANQVLVHRLGQIAAGKQVTPAQVTLAWLLAQKPWIVPIPGTTKRHRLEENLGAAAVALPQDDLGDIADALSTVIIQGDEHPAHPQPRVDR